MPSVRTQPLSLLFLIPSLASRGAERALVNLVNHLDPSRYHITLQVLFDVGDLRGELASHVAYRAGFPFSFRGNVQLLKLFPPRWLYRLIVGRRYDVVVAYLEGAVTRIIAGCPYPDSRKIAWVHIEQHDEDSFAHCYRSRDEAVRCYQAYDRVIAVSRTVKACIVRNARVSSSVIHNLIDTERILRLAKQQNQDLPFPTSLNVISVGALTPQKGYDRLIEVHRLVLRAGIHHHIYILGSGGEASVLRRLVEAAGVVDTFHLLGHRDNPYPYLLAADLFVCSSRQEGFSTAVSEAITLGVPVVSTDCSGAREILGQSDEYGIVTTNTTDGLFDGMMRMLSMPHLLRHYAAQARIRSSMFAMDHVLADHNTLFG